MTCLTSTASSRQVPIATSQPQQRLGYGRLARSHRRQPVVSDWDMISLPSWKRSCCVVGLCGVYSALGTGDATNPNAVAPGVLSQVPTGSSTLQAMRIALIMAIPLNTGKRDDAPCFQLVDRYG